MVIYHGVFDVIVAISADWYFHATDRAEVDKTLRRDWRPQCFPLKWLEASFKKMFFAEQTRKM